MTDNDDAYREPVVYPVGTIVELATRMLRLMERMVSGDAVDEAQYARVFGAKEGMVQQLQRVSDILREMRSLEAAVNPVPVKRQVPMGKEEQALIRHYVLQLAGQYAREGAQASANADDV